MYSGYTAGPVLVVVGMLQNPRSVYREIMAGVGRPFTAANGNGITIAPALAWSNTGWYAQLYLVPSFSVSQVTVSGTLQGAEPLTEGGVRAAYVSPANLLIDIGGGIGIGVGYLRLVRTRGRPDPWRWACPAARHPPRLDHARAGQGIRGRRRRRGRRSCSIPTGSCRLTPVGSLILAPSRRGLRLRPRLVGAHGSPRERHRPRAVLSCRQRHLQVRSRAPYPHRRVRPRPMERHAAGRADRGGRVGAGPEQPALRRQGINHQWRPNQLGSVVVMAGM